MKKRKKKIPPMLPIDRLIEPEILGGDPVNESSRGNPDSILAAELSFKTEDIPIIQVQDPGPDRAPVPEGLKIKKVRFPQWG